MIVLQTIYINNINRKKSLLPNYVILYIYNLHIPAYYLINKITEHFQ